MIIICVIEITQSSKTAYDFLLDFLNFYSLIQITDLNQML